MKHRVVFTEREDLELAAHVLRHVRAGLSVDKAIRIMTEERNWPYHVVRMRWWFYLNNRFYYERLKAVESYIKTQRGFYNAEQNSVHEGGAERLYSRDGGASKKSTGQKKT